MEGSAEYTPTAVHRESTQRADADTDGRAAVPDANGI
jgi:hypothetical protein